MVAQLVERLPRDPMDAMGRGSNPVRSTRKINSVQTDPGPLTLKSSHHTCCRQNKPEGTGQGFVQGTLTHVLPIYTLYNSYVTE